MAAGCLCPERPAGGGAALRVRLGRRGAGVLDDAHSRDLAPVRSVDLPLRRPDRATVAVAWSAGRGRLCVALRLHALGAVRDPAWWQFVRTGDADPGRPDRVARCKLGRL